MFFSGVFLLYKLKTNYDSVIDQTLILIFFFKSASKKKSQNNWISRALFEHSFHRRELVMIQTSFKVIDCRLFLHACMILILSEVNSELDDQKSLQYTTCQNLRVVHCVVVPTIYAMRSNECTLQFN